MKRRNPTTGKIEHVNYWANRPAKPTYRMDKQKATEIKGRDDDEDGPKVPPPSPS